jgi:hypothetical protein
MPTNPEKRQDDRKTYWSEVSLEFASGKHGVRISDLSLGGCYVDSIASVTEGEAITVTLSNKAGETMSLPGEVAYVMPGLGFGVRFQDLTQEQIDFLQPLVS